MRAWWSVVLVAACTGKATDSSLETGTPGETDTVDTHETSDTEDTEETEDTWPTGPLSLQDVEVDLLPELGTVPAVSWFQIGTAEAWVTWTTDGKAWRSSPPATVGSGPHQQLLLGIPFDTEVTWKLVVDDGVDHLETDEATIRTAPWPKTLPVPIVLTSQPKGWEPSTPYLLTSMNQVGDTRYGEWWSFIIDREGTVVWALKTPSDYVSRYVRVGITGRDILVDHDSYWPQSDGGDDSRVHRMYLDGVSRHTYLTPGLHHSFTELDDGRVVWLGNDGGSYVESLFAVDDAGAQVKIWDCDDDWVDGLGQGSNICGTNGLFWHPATDHFLVSSWAWETVIEVDHQTGTTVRYFGDTPGAWGFDPADSQFRWNHGPIFLDDGHLMVSSKRYDPVAERDETVAYEYELDEGAQKLREVWSFGKGEGIYGMYMGEVHRLANGNTLHNYGEESRVREVTDAGEIVWEVWWEGDAHIGRSTLFADLYDLAPPLE